MTLRELIDLRPGPYRRQGWPTACLGQGLHGDPWPRQRVDARVSELMFSPVAVEPTDRGFTGYGLGPSSLVPAQYAPTPEDLKADDWGPCDIAQFHAWAKRGWTR